MNSEPENARRDIVLIGGSMGGIDALLEIVAALPSDFPASLFVVMHTSPEGPGLLPSVIRRAGMLPATHPKNGENIERSRIYIAPPDRHMTLGDDDVVHISRGPRENGLRPAIDPLFRTAASRGYGRRAIGIVLSGYLDDGSAGLYAIRVRGGLTIVQNPTDAMAGDMPNNALRFGGVHYILPASEIGPKLIELMEGVEEIPVAKKREPKKVSESDTERELNTHRTAAYPGEGGGTPSVFACPECHGVLWEITEAGTVHFRCRVGHGYSEQGLGEELSRAAESALWAAMRALDEKAGMARRMADAASGPRPWINRLRDQADSYAAHAEMLRKMILGEHPVPEAETYEPAERDQAS